MDEKITRIYIGPTIKGVIQTGTAFKGGTPPYMEETVKREPYLMDLIVPAAELAEAKKKIRNPEDSLAMLYRKAETEGGKQDGI